MNTSFLTLRFTRRAIGAAAIRNGDMTLLDGRFLSAHPERTIPAALRYLDKLIGLVQPSTVVIDAPGSDRSTLANEVRRAVQERLAERAIPTLNLEKGDILSAFGVQRVVDRRQLRELITMLCPDLDRVRGKVKPYVADAAAAAMYGELVLVWNPVT